MLLKDLPDDVQILLNAPYHKRAEFLASLDEDELRDLWLMLNHLRKEVGVAMSLVQVRAGWV